MSKLIVEAVVEHWGERCSEFDADCFCCKAWKEYDELTTPAPCDELVTVMHQYEHSDPISGRSVWHDRLNWNGQHPKSSRELVTRKNAEAVIAAERMKLEATAKVGLQLSEQVEALEAENKRLREALAMSEAAISEFYRYQYGGEMRGSYDGKPERDGLWKAMYLSRAALGEVEP